MFVCEALFDTLGASQLAQGVVSKNLLQFALRQISPHAAS